MVDNLTLFQFCLNCGVQYTSLTFCEATGCIEEIGPGVLLAPLAGLGTSYKYVRAAQGAMERQSRIATLAAFMAMSGRATLTNPATNAAAGGTIASFIEHMKSVIEKSNSTKGGLVFVHLSKLTIDECIVFNLVIVGGILSIIVSSYILPRVGKAYWHYSQKAAEYTISSIENSIDHLKNSRKIKKLRYSISQLGQKIFVPFKYVGFFEKGVMKLGSYSWKVSKRTFHHRINRLKPCLTDMYVFYG